MTDQIESHPIKLMWESAADIPTHYANGLLAAHSGSEFYLIFGEVQLPFDTEITVPPDSLPVRPVVKIVVTPDNMARFLDVMQDNIQKFSRRQKEEEA